MATRKQKAKPAPEQPKRVRITVEVDGTFLKLLEANIHLTKAVRGWLLNNDDAADITAPQALGLLVYMEGRGGQPAQINASTPFMWRPHIDIIHGERRVFHGTEQISGPVLVPKV